MGFKIKVIGFVLENYKFFIKEFLACYWVLVERESYLWGNNWYEFINIYYELGLLDGFSYKVR